VPVDVIATEPSAALKLDFETALRFTRKHAAFGLNLTRLIAAMVSRVLMSDRTPRKPALIAIFHESQASRPLSELKGTGVIV